MNDENIAREQRDSESKVAWKWLTKARIPQCNTRAESKLQNCKISSQATREWSLPLRIITNQIADKQSVTVQVVCVSSRCWEGHKSFHWIIHKILLQRKREMNMNVAIPLFQLDFQVNYNVNFNVISHPLYPWLTDWVCSFIMRDEYEVNTDWPSTHFQNGLFFYFHHSFQRISRQFVAVFFGFLAHWRHI